MSMYGVKLISAKSTAAMRRAAREGRSTVDGYLVGPRAQITAAALWVAAAPAAAEAAAKAALSSLRHVRSAYAAAIAAVGPAVLEID